MLRFLFFLSFFITLASASGLVIKKPSDNFQKFSIERYEDTSGKLQLSDIIQKGNFVPSSNSMSYGYNQSHFWFRFSVTNQTNQNLTYVLESTETFFHLVDFYVLQNGLLRQSHLTGIGRINQDGMVDNVNPTMKIEFKPYETKTIYIRHFSLFPGFTSFELLGMEAFNVKMLRKNRLLFLYFGIALALVFYNLMVYLFSRDINYLLYVLYVAFFATSQLAVYGFPPFERLGSTQETYLYAALLPIFIAFLIFFSRRILILGHYFPKMDRLINYLGYLYLLLTLISLFEIPRTYQAINLLSSLVLPLLLFMGFKSYFAGNRVALFYVIAQILFLITSTIYSLMADGYLPYTNFTKYGYLVGSTIEMFLFSFALAYKLKLLELEKLEISKNANEKLKKLNAKLEQRVQEESHKRAKQEHLIIEQSKLAQMGEMLNMIAHQWRQPLSTISTCAINISIKDELQTLDSPTLQHNSAFIQQQTQELSHIIDDFLSFNKPSTNKLFGLKEIVERLNELVEAQFISRGITLKIDLDETIKVYHNPTKIEQVLLNLVINSRDAFEDNGITTHREITIYTTGKSAKKIDLVIEDNAGGISQKIIKKVFNPYFTTKQEGKGTGIGLYMTKQMVESIRGSSIRLENTHKGVRFIVTLPRD